MTKKREYTACATCGRVVWEADTDKDNNCVLCAKPEKPAKPAASEEPVEASEPEATESVAAPVESWRSPAPWHRSETGAGSGE